MKSDLDVVPADHMVEGEHVPRPFTLRVAVERYAIDEAPGSEGNQHLIFSRRAGLTGTCALTRFGEDVEISDVEIE